MGRVSLCSGLLFCFSISTILMFICQNHIMTVNGFSTLDQNQKEDTTNQHDTTAQNNYRILKSSNSRSGFAFSPRLLQQISSSASRTKIPIELDLLFDGDNELMEKQKRYDDYGHLRFGKRGGNGDQFDDYGHSRFGRSISG